MVFVQLMASACLALVTSTAIAQQPLNQTEMQCKAQVQGKVAWNKQGTMAWNDTNLNNLCRGTTDPAATISCFQGAIRANQTWQNAITQCQANGQTVITVPKAPTTRQGGSPQDPTVARVGAPPQNQYDAPPAAGYGAAPPAKGQYTAPPANGYGAAPPAKGQYTAPPSNGYGAAPPAKGQYTAPPSNGYGAAPPPANQYHAPPSASGNQYHAPPNAPTNGANQYGKVGVGGGEGNYGNVPVKPPDGYGKVGVGGGEGNYGNVPVKPPDGYGKVGVGGGEGNYGNVPVKPPDGYGKVGVGGGEGNYGNVPVKPPDGYGKVGVGGGEGNYGNVPVKPPDGYGKVGVGGGEGNYGNVPVKPPDGYGKVGVGGGEGNYGNVPVKPPDQYGKVGVGGGEGNYGNLPVKPPTNEYHAPPSAAGNQYHAPPNAPTNEYGGAPKLDNQYHAPPNAPGKVGVGDGEVAIKPKVSTAPSEGVHALGGVAGAGAAGFATGAALTAITEAASGQKVSVKDPTKLTFVGATNQPKDLCWRDSYPNGAGQTMGCSAGLEKSGQLCYPPVRAGYSCAGTVCLGNCPSGFADVGAVCQKPSSYGRGDGYASWHEDKCNSENSQGCEKNGLMWYPKCRANFHAVGCCTCSPDCPSGTTDTGVGCTKTNYTRGVGSPITTCGPGLQQNGLVCYNPCKTNYSMVGPVCWAQKCPASYPIQCGASCAVSHDACALSTESQVLTPLQVITNVVGIVVTGGGSAAAEVAAESAGKAAMEAGIAASLKAAAKSAGKTLADSAASSAASTFGSAEISGTFDFYSLDPTGVASVVEAYNKPICANVPQN